MIAFIGIGMLLGGAIGGVAFMLYRRPANSQAVVTAPAAAPLPPASPDSSPFARSKTRDEKTADVPTEESQARAQEAIEHYRRTSQTLRKEEIRNGYKQFCDKIVAKFSNQVTKGDQQQNELYRMVDTVDWTNGPCDQAVKEFPGTSWAGIRVVVDFRSAEKQIRYESYVTIGRTPDGKEVVGLLTYDRTHVPYDKLCKVLSDSAEKFDHEKIMSDTVRQELDKLTNNIIPDIRGLQ